MWIIKHIFDGDYGCEESDDPYMVTVTLVNEINEEIVKKVPEKWLTENSIDIGSEWPHCEKMEYSDVKG